MEKLNAAEQALLAKLKTVNFYTMTPAEALEFLTPTQQKAALAFDSGPVMFLEILYHTLLGRA